MARSCHANGSFGERRACEWGKALNDALAREDASAIKETLGQFARDRGMSQVSSETGLARESLYRSLDSKGNPEFTTILKVLSSIGLRLEGSPTKGRRKPSRPSPTPSRSARNRRRGGR
ncbi:addiction module antidote protein [Tardiphaga sp. 619_E2_N8_5]|uniref:addiction module antidote protein n=1 Tax=unclassified Tardiphaga TaxID=2631404 RepID=UPI003F2694B0